MKLSKFIDRHQGAIVGRWCQKVVSRLGLKTDQRPQLINDMPQLLLDLIQGLESSPEAWSSTSARAHARQRIALGVDIGGLSEEIGMVGETVLELAEEEQVRFENAETAAMCRILARGAAESVTEYARLRDGQLARESARHFSFIAHELRTPLQTARLAATLLPQEGQVVERLKRAHQQLSDLVDNSLIEARLTAEPDVQKELCASRDLVTAAIASGESLAEQQGVELSVECDQFEIEVDRKLIVSALSNLVVNGVKFSARGRRVVVRAEVQEERVHFEVADGCGGLPEGAASTMFQPFVQKGNDRTGFGLGLMIVKQAVDAHGGAIRVMNHPGNGCCFIVELPRLRSRLSRETAARSDGGD